jgi:hypothetical protein
MKCMLFYVTKFLHNELEKINDIQLELLVKWKIYCTVMNKNENHIPLV